MLITVPGKPIAKKRPRFYRRGNFVGTYSDQTTEEGRFQSLAASQVDRLLDGPVGLKCIFYMPVPKNTSKKKMDLIKKGFVPHIKRPDISNLLKFIEDCLNGIAWKDDSQISKLTAYKIYGLEPKTEIYIEHGQ